jgi:hypothetical protein
MFEREEAVGDGRSAGGRAGRPAAATNRRAMATSARLIREFDLPIGRCALERIWREHGLGEKTPQQISAQTRPGAQQNFLGPVTAATNSQLFGKVIPDNNRVSVIKRRATPKVVHSETKLEGATGTTLHARRLL